MRFWGDGGMGELIVGGGGLGETRWKISLDFRSPEVGITVIRNRFLLKLHSIACLSVTLV